MLSDVYGWEMDDLTTFLELPLDRELYKPKEYRGARKKPLRVMITETGSKIAYNLLYKICSGQVFGPDQDVILHLVNAKGSVDLNITIAELHGCGFDVLLDAVISSEATRNYGNVDVVVLIAPFEELSGHAYHGAFLYQLVKSRMVARNIQLYAKPDTKLVIASPSTKGIIVLLTCLKLLEHEFPVECVSGVVILDEVISKNLLAAQLKTTTDKIKNIVIWGATHPDVREATVLASLPEDQGDFEKVQVPVKDALQNDKWLDHDFVASIYRRVIESSFVRHGMSVASATAKHLKALIQGTDTMDEIVSMGIIVPENQPYGFDENIGISAPVLTKNGNVKVREDVKFSTRTHLLNIQDNYKLQNDSSMQSVCNLINYIKEYEVCTKKDFIWSDGEFFSEKLHFYPWRLKQIISPIENDKIGLSGSGRNQKSKKSITWDDIHAIKSQFGQIRSFLRFEIREEYNPDTLSLTKSSPKLSAPHFFSDTL